MEEVVIWKRLAGNIVNNGGKDKKGIDGFADYATFIAKHIISVLNRPFESSIKSLKNNGDTEAVYMRAVANLNDMASDQNLERYTLQPPIRDYVRGLFRPIKKDDPNSAPLYEVLAKHSVTEDDPTGYGGNDAIGARGFRDYAESLTTEIWGDEDNRDIVAGIVYKDLLNLFCTSTQ